MDALLRHLAPTVVVAVLFIGYAYVRPGPSALALGLNIAIAAIASVGLTLAIGGAGQLALGQAGFIAIGAYGTAYAMKADHLPFLAGVAVSIVGAMLAGALVGYIALRLSDNYLAMATLAVGAAIYGLLELPNRLGGQNGYIGIPPASIGGYPFLQPRAQYLLAVAALLIVVVLARWLSVSRAGRELLALRDDEVAARAVGINITARKVQIFAVASAIGALAGAVNAPLQTAIDPSLFSPAISLELFVMVVLGGLGSIYGAVFGAALVTWLDQAFPGNGSWSLTILGAVVVVSMALAPNGFAGLTRPLARLRLAIVARRTGDSPPRPKVDSGTVSPDISRPGTVPWRNRP